MRQPKCLAFVVTLSWLTWSGVAGRAGLPAVPAPEVPFAYQVKLLSPSTDADLVTGRPVPLRVRLSRNGRSVIGAPGVFVTAVVAHPQEAGEDIVRLRDDGKLGDAHAGDGEWAAVYRDIETPGRYGLGLKIAEREGETKLSDLGGFTLQPPAVIRTTTVPARRVPARREPSRPPSPVWWAGAAGALGLVAGWLARRPRPSSGSPENPVGSTSIVSVPSPMTSPMTSEPARSADLSAEAALLRAECDRLRSEAEGAREQAVGDERRNLFQSMAQMLVQLPSVRKAVQDGADLRARDLLPLLSPLDGAVRQMGIEPIGAVGEVTAFDAAVHQPSGQGLTLLPGQEVRIKFVGYRMGGAVLRRAQVEVVANPSN